MTLILSGCASREETPEPQVVTVVETVERIIRVRPNLPPPPSAFGQIVPMPKLTLKANAKAMLAETRVALALANERLAHDAAFYAHVRKHFGNSQMGRK